MPIYEYRCEHCGHELEKLQKMNDDPLVYCPSCQQPKLKKLISAAGFRLKGGGWYETDFKQGKKKNLMSKDSAEKKNSDKKSAKSDTSATKSETKSSSTSSDK